VNFSFAARNIHPKSAPAVSKSARVNSDVTKIFNIISKILAKNEQFIISIVLMKG